MYSFCCRGGGEGGVYITHPLGRWRVPSEFLDISRPWLQHDILDRFRPSVLSTYLEQVGAPHPHYV
jgi:hypothetical protein